MGQYTKIKSGYIQRKNHQTLSDGSSIFERDWVTIGNIGKLEPGKRPYYADGNFVFTVAATSDFKKKHGNGKWVGSYYMGDVEGQGVEVNSVKVNFRSNDLRNYAYYGSASELVRTTVEDIISTFPGNLAVTDVPFIKEDLSGHDYTVGYIIRNQFGIDMHTDSPDLTGYADEMKYLAVSRDRYEVIDDEGVVHGIESYQIYNYVDVVPDQQMYHDAGYEYVYYNGNMYKWNGTFYSKVDFSDNCENYFVKCNDYIRYKDVYYEWSDEDMGYNPINVYEICDDMYQLLYSIVIGLTDTDESVTVYAYKSPSGFMYVTSNHPFVIQPQDKYIDAYFASLDGFAQKLLDRGTNPLYTAKFLVPYEMSTGAYAYTENRMTWPSHGYCIDIDSPVYYQYISSLYELGNAYDSRWSDNIWQRMTHEAIQDFDWSYRREYDDINEAEYTAGGQRMQDIVRLQGRVYDELKRFIDGIKYTGRITYDGCDNVTNAELSDKTGIYGWDNVSTIWEPYYYKLLPGLPEGATAVAYPVVPVKVSDTDPDYISVGCGEYTLYYMKTVNDPSAESLGSSYVYGEYSEGEPWIGKVNPWIRTNLSGYHYQLLGSTEPPVPEGYWSDYNTFYGTDVPFVLTDESPRYIRLIGNYGGAEYYEKRQEFKEECIHDKWYGGLAVGGTTPATVDLDYQRRLMLSGGRIFRSKGTLESVEMVMGLFGLGLGEDYTLTERYWSYSPRKADGIFPFYGLLNTEPVGIIWTDGVNSFVEMPAAHEGGEEYVRVGEGPNFTYYQLDVSHTLAEVVDLLWENKTTESDYDDTLSGVPLNEVTVGNDRYIIPFYTRDRVYEGNLYFQMNGGWGKKDEDTDNRFNYEESVSYLHMLPNVSALLNVLPRDLSDGDIYYVNDVSDYVEYDEDVPYDLSQFFKCTDRYNPQNFASWKNIPMEGAIVYESDYDRGGVTHQDYLHAKYLAGIVPTYMFNNPHVGYGKYDNGQEFLEFMRRPYRYLVDNFEFTNAYYLELAKQVEFSLSGQDVEADGETKVFNLMGTHNGEVDRINDKTLVLRNILNSNIHRQFLMDVVMKYVMQVIPSTTILVLENFELEDSQGLVYYDITAEPSDVSKGSASGSGRYLQATYAILKAERKDGYRFMGWEKDGEDYSRDNVIKVLVCGDATYTAVFADECGFTAECMDVCNLKVNCIITN